MVKKNRMRPVHPGEYLAEELEISDLTVDTLAEALGVNHEHLHEVIGETRDVDAELALRLARYFGTSAEIWIDLQSLYSLKVAERDLGERIKREVEPRVEDAAEVAEVA